MLLSYANWALVVFTSFVWSYWNTVFIKTYNDNILLLIVITSVTLLYFILDWFRTTRVTKGRILHAFFIINTLTAYFLFKAINIPMPVYVLNVGVLGIFQSQVAKTSSIFAGMLCVLTTLILLLMRDTGHIHQTESNISWYSFAFLTFIHLHFCNLVFYSRPVRPCFYSVPLFRALYHITALMFSFWILPKFVTKTLLLSYHDQQNGTFLLVLFAETLILVSLYTLKGLNVSTDHLNLITTTCSTLGVFLCFHSQTTNLVFLASICILIVFDSQAEWLQVF
jgi:hypothetical protein